MGAADGADGRFERSAYPYYAGAASTLTAERNLDAERPEKGLCSTQVPSEGAWIFKPAVAFARLHPAFKAKPQKIGCASSPGVALTHQFPNASSDRICVNDALDRCLPIGCVGASKGAGVPED